MTPIDGKDSKWFNISDHFRFFYPSPKQTFYPKWGVSDNVGLGEG